MPLAAASSSSHTYDDAVQREPERGSWRDLCPHTAGGGRYQGGGGRA
eukprot:COSAG01_NODE_2550_length_7464_cov_14.290699_10_plen_46_part_01